MADEASIKGVSLVHLRDYLVSHHGEEGLHQVLQALSPESAQVLNRPFATDWYPLKTMVAIERAIIDQFHGGDPREAYRFGQYDLERAVSRIYRIIFPLLDPTFLVKKSARLFQSMISQGRVRIEQPNPRHLYVYLEELDPLDEVYCNDWRGSLIGMFKACGVDCEVRHDECRLRGAPHCRYQVTW